MNQNYRFTVRMAEITFVISVRNLQTKIYCKDYEAEEASPPAFEVVMTEEDIVAEWKEMLHSGKYTKEFVNHLPGYYFEIFALHKKTAEKLLDYGVFVFHGSAVALDGEAYLFTAKTGEGKSTHTRLWCTHFGEKRTKMINDDKPFLKWKGEQLMVYGSPWAGKHQRQNNLSAPLHAIGILHQDQKNHIEPAESSEAYEQCKFQVLPVQEKKKREKLQEFVRKMLEETPVYVLGCNISEKAAEMAWMEMKN